MQFEKDKKTNGNCLDSEKIDLVKYSHGADYNFLGRVEAWGIWFHMRSND